MSGLAELARFPTRVDADLARLRLEAAGIGAVLFDEGMNYIGLGPAMPVRLMVLEEDVEEAARL
ncbi:MAG TPA: DUF2007 domain-containing protein, partial [Sphingomicrobium sp.]|nr:DUF2007 domain-containing protein [Sphingomicrobium sp.]